MIIRGAIGKMKNLAYVSILISLAAIAIIILNRQPFGKKNSSFAIEPNIPVTEVEFSLGNETLILEREENGRWKVNDRYEVRTNGIAFIEKILTGMEIKSTVSSENFEKEIISNNIEPVRVRIYERKKVVRSFFVYKTASNIYGNIMKTSKNAKPFIVHVPGFDTNIGSAFTLNENYWRPYTLFSVLPSEIKSIEFENFADTTTSFTIQSNMNNDVFSIYPESLEEINVNQINRYLSYFSMVPFESWALDLSTETVGEITSRMAFLKIRLTTLSGDTTSVTAWPREIEGRLDTDRLWARINDEMNLVVVKYFDIDPLLKKRSYFFVD